MSDRQKFFSVVSEIKLLAPYFDQEKGEILIDDFEQRIKTMSSSEKHLAYFFANVWFNKEKYPLNIIDFTSTVDLEYRKIVSDWILEPYWP